MVNTIDFGNRLHLLMDHYTLSASAFADSLAIGRSSISHILSGRNKPSLEFILKIIDTYTDVDIHWLLYGKGTFPKSEIHPISETPSTPSIDSSKEDVIPLENNADLFSQSKENTTVVEEPIPYKKKQSTDTTTPTPDKTIDRILICYTDGSFDTYHNTN